VLFGIVRRLQAFSLHTCAYLFLGSLVIGTLAYMAIEGYGIGEAIYMAVITISTVGFSEVRPLSTAGRIFTSLYVITNLGITALFLSQLTQTLRDGGLVTRFYQSLMDRQIARLSGHVIVCGAGRYGREVVDQLADSDETVVLIERDRENIDRTLEDHPELLYVEDDATRDEILERVHIRQAKCLIVTLGDDSDNAFAVLSARQLAPQLIIIARVYESESRAKLLRVGATHVVQPEHIGSFFMATLVRKPSAVEFFTSLANGPDSKVGFEEVSYGTLSKDGVAGTLLELDLRRQTGASVVALRHPGGEYIVNPNPSNVLEPATSLIALGDREQLARLRALVST